MAISGQDSALTPTSSPRVAAIIVAAGESKRMGGQDKIFAPLLAQPLLAWTVNAFQASPCVDTIVLVIHPKNLRRAAALVRAQGYSKVEAICPGGARRQDSVRHGLDRVGDAQWVIIHDGARPCVDPSLIQRGVEEAQRAGAAVAATPVKDTIKLVSPDDGFVLDTPPRPHLWAVQTPQVFRSDLIRRAHELIAEDAPDDAAMVERLGHQVKVYPGSYENIKVTTPLDLAYAELILKRRCYDTTEEV